MTKTCNLVDVTHNVLGLTEREYIKTWRFKDDTTAAGGSDPALIRIYAANYGPDRVPPIRSAYRRADPGLAIVAPVVDRLAILKTLTYSRENPIESSNIWTIVGAYKTLEPGENNEEEKTQNPLLRPAKYWFEADIQTEPVEEAWLVTSIPNSGRKVDELGPIVNAAGVTFETPLMEDVQRTVIAIQKNYPSLEAIHNINKQYYKTTNLDVYKTYPRDCAQYQWTDTSEPSEEGGVSYYSGTTRILVSGEPIYKGFVNEGFEQLVPTMSRSPLVTDPAAGSLVKAPITYQDENQDNFGERVTEPALLDANGKRLESGVVGNLVKYRTRKRVSYAGLNL